MPQDMVLRMLHSINRRINPRPPRHPAQRQIHIARLLQLLPPSFHPAVILSCCMLLDDDRGCRIYAYIYGGAVAGGPGLGRLTSQMLQAAAPLATEGLDGTNAWPQDSADDPDPGKIPAKQGARSHEEPGQSAQSSPVTHTPTHGLPQPAEGAAPHPLGCEWPWRSRLPGGSLTQLILDLPDKVASRSCSEQEAPQTCHMRALAQLRTLRALSLTAPNVNVLRVPACTAALHSLPDLQQLGIRINRAVGHEVHTQELLSGVCAMTRLASLRLYGCFIPGRSFTCSASAQRSMSELLELPRLTSITLGQQDLVWAYCKALLDTLPQMRQVREIRVEVDLSHEESFPDRMMWALASATQLTALQRLYVFGFELGMNTFGRRRRGDQEVAGFHRHLREANPGLLGRLTQLPLASCCIGEDQAGALAALLADLPDLEALDLVCNPLGDNGMLAVAAVLPRLTRLTCVHLGGHTVSDVGMFAVLTALLAPWSQGGSPMRCLSVGSERFPPQRVGAMAAMIRSFRRLERLSISGLGLGLEGVGLMVQALQGLPHLRSLHVDGNVSSEESPGRAQLLHVLAPLTQIHTLFSGAHS